MKKEYKVLLLIVAALALLSLNLFATPPSWTTTKELHKRTTHIFVPTEAIYFDLQTNTYLYQQNGIWVESATIPPTLSTATLANSPQVEIRSKKTAPYKNYLKHLKTYQKQVEKEQKAHLKQQQKELKAKEKELKKQEKKQKERLKMEQAMIKAQKHWEKAQHKLEKEQQKAEKQAIKSQQRIEKAKNEVQKAEEKVNSIQKKLKQ